MQPRTDARGLTEGWPILPFAGRRELPSRSRSHAGPTASKVRSDRIRYARMTVAPMLVTMSHRDEACAELEDVRRIWPTIPPDRHRAHDVPRMFCRNLPDPSSRTQNDQPLRCGLTLGL